MPLANVLFGLGHTGGNTLDYYVHGGERIILSPSSQRVAVSFDPQKNAQQILAHVQSMKGGVGKKRSILHAPSTPLLVIDRLEGNMDPLLGMLFQYEAFRPGPPVFETSDGSLFIPDGKVDADLSGPGAEEIAFLLETARATVAEKPSRSFPFHVLKPRDGNAFRLANELAEQLHVEAQPRFVKLLKTLPPPMAVVPPVAGLPTGLAQILYRQPSLGQLAVPSAWELTQGEGAVVALLDSGVDLEHPELEANLLPSYDAGPSPLPVSSPSKANAHGTACAGLIAAGGRHALGVAPRCSLIPIRIGDFSGEYIWCAPEAIARSIYYAASHGAWVISNSYGGPLPEAVVSKALADAILHGRNGRGCVVVASTGNSNGPVMFPARDRGVIAVAAAGSAGERWVTNTHGSCFGPEVSVAAPGTRLWTTDIRGPRGYTALPPGPGADYTEFSGTSAATPLVAGVAALILSINPNLTALQVRQILEMTALPPGGAPKPNIFLGHGLVNAFAAVQEARRRLLQS